MVKKLLILSILFILSSFIFVSNNTAFSAPTTEAPKVNCIWLPGCPDEDIANPGGYNPRQNITLEWIGAFIAELIKYVAVVAVISVMLSWMMYLFSGWEEEKVKKARVWITWSLVWVLLSISAWGIINLLNTLTIW
jgi:hypothetical protein